MDAVQPRHNAPRRGFRSLPRVAFVGAVASAVFVLALVALQAPLFGQTPTEPAIVLAPTTAQPGESVTVTGTRFPVDTGVRILLDPIAQPEVVATATTDRSGAFSETFDVPQRRAGSYTVEAVSDCCGEFPPGARATLVISPIFSITPARGAVRSEIRAAGRGWDARAGPVTIFLDQSDLVGQRPPLAVVEVDKSGGFETTVEVPARPADAFTVLACQSCSEPSAAGSAVAPFVLLPTLVVAPPRGMVGQHLAVEGTGWHRDDEVSIVFDGVAVAEDVVDEATAFATEFPVPVRPPGSYVVAACQFDCRLTAPSSFTVVTEAASPAEGGETKPDERKGGREPRPEEQTIAAALSSAIGVEDKTFSLLLNLVVTLLGGALGARSPVVRGVVREVVTHPLRKARIDLTDGSTRRVGE